jgi:hypothetical protein
MRSIGTNRASVMAERFLALGRAERGEIIRALAPKIRRAPAVIEKDIWVCWVLEALFTMTGRVRMAFKGGTSLSKVYGAIHRFSEDVDVTLDYRALAPGADPFAPGVSKTKIKKLATDLKERVRQHAVDVVVPHFERLTREGHSPAGMSVRCDQAGEKIWIDYDSTLEERPIYMADSVLIELGGRNITEPSEEHRLVPFAADQLPELEWPVATVEVLSPARTFWEKATLIHAECNRDELKATPERLSRHWYDLALLAAHAIGEKAEGDRALLASVVEHKEVFFHAAHARYRDCLHGKLRLVPGEAMCAELRNDFEAMREAGMFDREPPTFDDILEQLGKLAERINGSGYDAV